jgi:hypothetical protein
MNEARPRFAEHTQSTSTPAGFGSEQTLCQPIAQDQIAWQEIDLAFEDSAELH